MLRGMNEGDMGMTTRLSAEDTREAAWARCVAFHGHACPGLTIGFQAARYVRELFGFERAVDEELVCIAENDACGVDAIQVLLGCSLGKGNLLLRLRGKQAYNFITAAAAARCACCCARVWAR